MGLKKKKVGVVRPKWKSLRLNEAILNSGIEGLVGIEELTDYTILKGKRRKIPDDLIEDASKEDYGKKYQKKKATSHSVVETNSLPKSKKRKLTQVTEDLLQNKKHKKNVDTKERRSKIVNSTNTTAVNPFLLSEELEDARSRPSSMIILPTKKIRGKKSKKMNAGQSPEVTSVEVPLKESLISATSESSTKSKNKKNLKKKKGLKEIIPLQTKKNRPKMKKQAKLRSKNELKEDEECESQVAVIQDPEDPSTTLIGMEGWAGLNLPLSIMKALAEKGFKTPTEIQALSLPAAVLGRRDILGAAETGSGKTLAFGIPIIHGILQQKKREADLEGDKDTEDVEITSSLNAYGGAESDNYNCEEEDASGYESEVIETNADGIGCVRVIDNIDMDEFGEVAMDTKPPRNPSHNQRLYALVLTPTRELAIQVRDHLKDAAKYTGIRVAVVVGGLASQKQERLLRTSPEIVVATPGRLWELIQEGNNHLQQVDDISFLAIDETDRMVERGHFQELRDLLKRINRDETKKKRRQNFVFSATLTTVHDPPRRKKRGKDQMRVTPGQKLQDVINMLGITHPKVVDITQESGTALTLEEAQISCTFEEKDIYLYYFLIKHPGRTLIFCNSISCVRRLATLLNILHCKPLPIHANMAQRQRLRNLDKFRDSPSGLLLATDVAARGLDIPNVQHVIHYQVPRTSEGYIHRSGRTARANKEGLTVLLVEPEEHQVYTRLCRTLGRAQEIPTFPISQDLLGAAKQRVMLARDIDQLELKSRRADTEMGWFQKAMSEMEMILDKDDLPMRISEEDTSGNRKAANMKRKQLEYLLSRPLFASRMLQ